ncbi:MAG: GH92 family glycosyl hydrolase [Chitinophagaceae bacterium]
MKKNTIFNLFLFASIITLVSCNMKKQPVDYVNPFIGTGGHGHTYPGASLPFGMVQLSPDNGTEGWDWCSGYHYSDSVIVGFSHLHLSGTGCCDLYDILLMPVNQPMDLQSSFKDKMSTPYRSKFSHSNEVAMAGYYQVFLDDPQVNVELTTGDFTGLSKFTFKDPKNPGIILDLGRRLNWDNTVSCYLKIIDNNRIVGYRVSEGFTNYQKVYFCATFSEPFTNVVVYNDTVLTTDKELTTQKIRALFEFKEKLSSPILVKTSLSSASIEEAINANDNEIKDFNFEKVKNSNRERWNEELSKINLEQALDSVKTIFYTALYHAYLAPTRLSGYDSLYIGADRKVHKAVDFIDYSTFSLWDVFRAAMPLYTITQPERVKDFLESFYQFYKQYGLLPVWTLYGAETNCMTGYHAIPVITDAYFKGILSKNVDSLYEAMKKSSMQNIRSTDLYRQYKYIPSDKVNRSDFFGRNGVTITLEYAYDDWCIAQMAKALNKEEDYKYYMDRSNYYKNLFDSVTGFMRPRLGNGQFKEPFIPTVQTDDYTEGNAWQHTWFVPQDINGLISLYGGNEQFIVKLDSLFTMSSHIEGDHTPDISGMVGQYAHGNEPSHHVSYLYDYAGTPWKTQSIVRKIMDSLYTTQPDGLCGNEDCGQMSAWYVFSALGFYPVNPASGIYAIGTPIISRASVSLSNGKSFVVIADNLSKENMYIQSAMLNDQPLNQAYIMHQDIMEGGTLHFKMGNMPNKEWGIEKKIPY